MKTCFKCRETKPLSEFYVHPATRDGRLNKCKSCTKKDVTKHRDENLEKIREYDRERAKLPHRIKAATKFTKSYRAAHKQRDQCNAAVARAIKSGALKKLPCFICGGESVEGHHPDYSAPLDVVWLCAVHHKEIHLKHPRE